MEKNFFTFLANISKLLLFTDSTEEQFQLKLLQRNKIKAVYFF